VNRRQTAQPRQLPCLCGSICLIRIWFPLPTRLTDSSAGRGEGIKLYILCHGEVLTFLDSNLHRSLCAIARPKVSLFPHPGSPTVYHRMRNGEMGYQLRYWSIKVETHTAHDHHSNYNSNIQSKNFSALIIQGVYAHYQHTYIGGNNAISIVSKDFRKNRHTSNDQLNHHGQELVK